MKPLRWFRWICIQAVLYFDVPFSTRIGDMEADWWRIFPGGVGPGGITLHIQLMHGKNNHHIAEAVFKAFGQALRQAASIDERIQGVLSTKGTL